MKEISIHKVESFTIHKITISEIDGEIQLSIKNPNTTGFSIYPSEFDIIYNNTKLGKARLNKRVHIGPNSEKTYAFKLHTNLENLTMLDVFNIINSGRSGTIKLNGNLKAGKFFIKRKYPVNYTDKVNLLND